MPPVPGLYEQLITAELERLLAGLSPDHLDLVSPDAADTHVAVAAYVSHRGIRPIAVTWRLGKAMPEDFFREAKVTAG